MLKKNDLLNMFTTKNLNFVLHEHEKLFSVQDSLKNRGSIDGAHSKNLFLKNKKNKFFLFSCIENKKIDLKTLSKSLDLGNISFAKENYLLTMLGVFPGSVSPFALLNDKKENISFYLDVDFLLFKKINFHPLVNSSTINMATDTFLEFMNDNNIKVNIFDFKNYCLIKEV